MPAPVSPRDFATQDTAVALPAPLGHAPAVTIAVVDRAVAVVDRAVAVPGSPLSPGDVISGKFRVDSHLSTGGMGVVYVATHLGLGTRVAIKVLRPDLVPDGESALRLWNEARAAATLRGEHVVRILDIGRLASGAPYLVMEYLEGLDLCELLDRVGPLPVTQTVDLVLQACEALAEAHAAGIIHRDVKPENLFVTHGADGSLLLKVLDFGISKQLHAAPLRSITNPSLGVGSPHYMSPEQMRTPRDIDARADIWSLGIVLYELLTGQPAFDGETVPEVCAHVISEDAPRVRRDRPDVPAKLEAVLRRCMSKPRGKRFADVRELAEALAPFGSEASAASVERIGRILERHGVDERSEPLLGPAGPPSARPAAERARRARAAAVLLAVALLSGVVAFGAGWSFQRSAAGSEGPAGPVPALHAAVVVGAGAQGAGGGAVCVPAEDARP